MHLAGKKKILKTYLIINTQIAKTESYKPLIAHKALFIITFYYLKSYQAGLSEYRGGVRCLNCNI